MSDQKTVDFGLSRVSPAEKTRRVGDVFARVAHRYDLMNDLMSFGTHRLFKRMVIEMSGARPGMKFLDLAGGTGDMTSLLAPVVGDEGMIVLADINARMIAAGRDRLLNEGRAAMRYCQTSAERLPFTSNLFDGVTIAFGLRNFTDKQKALLEIQRILAPGGVLLILEFSKPDNPLLRSAYSTFQAFWPAMGKLIVGDADSYRYLVESIQVHPSQQALKLMLQDSGFDRVEYRDLLGGVAAIHRGVKP